MMVRPPGLPVTSTMRPSRATMAGVMLESIRLPGSARLGRVPIRPAAVVSPGAALKSPISLFSRKPAPGTTIFEPYDCSSVVVSATALRSASTTDRCVVSCPAAGHSNVSGPDTEARSGPIVARRPAA